MRAIITGFKPRPGKISPSMMIVNRLDRTKVGGLDVVGAELPEDYATVPRLVKELVEEQRPRVAISVGWDTPAWVKVQMVAINVMSARVGDKIVPDHEGHAPEMEPVVKGGPLAYASTLPANEIVRRITEEGIPSFVSYETGTHVRNAVMYSLLHWTTTGEMHTLAGQIHVPPLPGMFGKDQPTMDLEKEVRAVEIIIQTCAESYSGDRRRRTTV